MTNLSTIIVIDEPQLSLSLQGISYTKRFITFAGPAMIKFTCAIWLLYIHSSIQHDPIHFWPWTNLFRCLQVTEKAWTQVRNLKGAQVKSWTQAWKHEDPNTAYKIGGSRAVAYLCQTAAFSSISLGMVVVCCTCIVYAHQHAQGVKESEARCTLIYGPGWRVVQSWNQETLAAVNFAAADSKVTLGPCLDPTQNLKFPKILRHIESCGTCMEH